ncbi:unnamed protein product [Vitrella brassicaformis CCMP3155]|uniref:Apple domain-containing protein n=7 Tax=Vitrella brassicaformis TaxID=1169539 RepID=A0A0G4EMH2_VITBC|nr:unnamed protein product [Vitrella brassicaformis CCMP3155]|eukprot:CEL98168.1 unnamed protein product [Vitrella brassicaformis CCMP3155]
MRVFGSRGLRSSLLPLAAASLQWLWILTSHATEWSDEFANPASAECQCNGTITGCPTEGRYFLYNDSFSLHGYTLNASIPETDLDARRHECAVLCLAHPACTGFEYRVDSERRCEVHMSFAKLPPPEERNSTTTKCVRRKGGANKIDPAACRLDNVTEPIFSLADVSSWDDPPYSSDPINPPTFVRRALCSEECIKDRRCTGIDFTAGGTAPECRLLYSLVNSGDPSFTDRVCFYKSGLPVPALEPPVFYHYDVAIITLTVSFGETVSAGFAPANESFATNGTLTDIRSVAGNDTIYEAVIVPDAPPVGSSDNITFMQLTVMHGIVMDDFENPNPNTNLSFARGPLFNAFLSSPQSAWQSAPVELTVTFDRDIGVFDPAGFSFWAHSFDLSASGSVSVSNVRLQPNSATVDILPSIEGKVKIWFLSGFAFDAYIPGRSSYVSPMLELDFVYPFNVTLSSAKSLWESLPIELAIAFDKPVSDADFSLADLVLSLDPYDPGFGGSVNVIASNLRRTPASGPFTHALVDLEPTVDGNVTVVLPFDTVSDADRPIRGNNPAQLVLEYRTPVPTAVLYIEGASSNTTAAYPISVNVTFSKKVTIDDIAKLELVNSQLVGSGPGAITRVSDNSFYFAVEPTGETVTITAGQGLAVDDVSQPNNRSLPLVVTFDYINSLAALDWVTNVTLSMANTLFNTASFQVTLTFSKAIVDTDFSTKFLIDSSPVTAMSLQRLGATEYTATLAVPASKGDGDVMAVELDERAVTDTDGLTNRASNTLSVEYDPMPPDITISSSSAPATRHQDFFVDVAVSEVVQPFTTSIFTVVNAAIVSMADNPSQANAKILEVRAATEGTVTITVEVGQVADIVGNTNHRISTLSLEYDITPPSLVFNPASVSATEEAVGVSVTSSEASDVFCQPLKPADIATYTASDFDLINVPPATSISPKQERRAVGPAAFAGAFSFSALVPDTTHNISCIAIDVAGNVMDKAAALTVKTTAIIPPRVLVPNSNDTVVITNDRHLLTLHFSEAVRDINTANIVVSNAALIDSSIREQLYLDLVLEVSTQGPVSVTLNEGAVRDSYGSKNIFYTYTGLFYDIDECATGGHNCSDTCHNTLGGFICHCPASARLQTDMATCLVQASIQSVDVSRAPHTGIQLSVALTGSRLSPTDELILFPLTTATPQAHSSSLLQLISTNAVDTFYLLPCAGDTNTTTTLSCGPMEYATPHGYIVALCHEEWIPLSPNTLLQQRYTQLAATPDAVLAGQLSIDGGEVSGSAACQSLTYLMDSDPSAFVEEIVVPGTQPLASASEPLSVVSFSPTTLNEAELQTINILADAFDVGRDRFKIATCGECATSEGFGLTCDSSLVCITVVHRIAPELCLCKCDASLTLDGDCLADHSFSPAHAANFTIVPQSVFVSAVEYVEQRHPPQTGSSLQLTVRGHHLDPSRDRLALVPSEGDDFTCGGDQQPSTLTSLIVHCSWFTEHLVCDNMTLPHAGSFKACLCDGTQQGSCLGSADFSIEPAVDSVLQTYSGMVCGQACVTATECETFTQSQPSCGPRCGNGVVEASEDCDDGNNLSQDGCDSRCKTESGDALYPLPRLISAETSYSPATATVCFEAPLPAPFDRDLCSSVDNIGVFGSKTQCVWATPDKRCILIISGGHDATIKHNHGSIKSALRSFDAVHFEAGASMDTLVPTSRVVAADSMSLCSGSSEPLRIDIYTGGSGGRRVLYMFSSDIPELANTLNQNSGWWPAATTIEVPHSVLSQIHEAGEDTLTSTISAENYLGISTKQTVAVGLMKDVCCEMPTLRTTRTTLSFSPTGQMRLRAYPHSHGNGNPESIAGVTWRAHSRTAPWTVIDLTGQDMSRDKLTVRVDTNDVFSSREEFIGRVFDVYANISTTTGCERRASFEVKIDKYGAPDLHLHLQPPLTVALSAASSRPLVTEWFCVWTPLSGSSPFAVSSTRSMPFHSAPELLLRSLRHDAPIHDCLDRSLLASGSSVVPLDPTGTADGTFTLDMGSVADGVYVFAVEASQEMGEGAVVGGAVTVSSSGNEVSFRHIDRSIEMPLSSHAVDLGTSAPTTLTPLVSYGRVQAEEVFAEEISLANGSVPAGTLHPGWIYHAQTDDWHTNIRATLFPFAGSLRADPRSGGVVMVEQYGWEVDPAAKETGRETYTLYLTDSYPITAETRIQTLSFNRLEPSLLVYVNKGDYFVHSKLTDALGSTCFLECVGDADLDWSATSLCDPGWDRHRPTICPFVRVKVVEGIATLADIMGLLDAMRHTDDSAEIASAVIAACDTLSSLGQQAVSPSLLNDMLDFLTAMSKATHPANREEDQILVGEAAERLAILAGESSYTLSAHELVTFLTKLTRLIQPTNKRSAALLLRILPAVMGALAREGVFPDDNEGSTADNSNATQAVARDALALMEDVYENVTALAYRYSLPVWYMQHQFSIYMRQYTDDDMRHGVDRGRVAIPRLPIDALRKSCTKLQRLPNPPDCSNVPHNMHMTLVQFPANPLLVKHNPANVSVISETLTVDLWIDVIRVPRVNVTADAPVMVSFTLPAGTPRGRAFCMYFDEGSQTYVDAGCRVTATTWCACTHMSSFTAAIEALVPLPAEEEDESPPAFDTTLLLNMLLAGNIGFTIATTMLYKFPVLSLWLRDRVDWAPVEDRLKFFFRDRWERTNYDVPICICIPFMRILGCLSVGPIYLSRRRAILFPLLPLFLMWSLLKWLARGCRHAKRKERDAQSPNDPVFEHRRRKRQSHYRDDYESAAWQWDVWDDELQTNDTGGHDGRMIAAAIQAEPEWSSIIDQDLEMHVAQSASMKPSMQRWQSDEIKRMRSMMTFDDNRSGCGLEPIHEGIGEDPEQQQQQVEESGEQQHLPRSKKSVFMHRFTNMQKQLAASLATVRSCRDRKALREKKAVRPFELHVLKEIEMQKYGKIADRLQHTHEGTRRQRFLMSKQQKEQERLEQLDMLLTQAQIDLNLATTHNTESQRREHAQKKEHVRLQKLIEEETSLPPPAAVSVQVVSGLEEDLRDVDLRAIASRHVRETPGGEGEKSHPRDLHEYQRAEAFYMWVSASGRDLCLHPASHFRERKWRGWVDWSGPLKVIDIDTIEMILQEDGDGTITEEIEGNGEAAYNQRSPPIIALYGREPLTQKQHMILKLRPTNMEQDQDTQTHDETNDAEPRRSSKIPIWLKLYDFFDLAPPHVKKDEHVQTVPSGMTALERFLFAAKHSRESAMKAWKELSLSGGQQVERRPEQQTSWFTYEGPLPCSACFCLVNGKPAHLWWTHDGLVLNTEKVDASELLPGPEGEEGHAETQGEERRELIHGHFLEDIVDVSEQAGNVHLTFKDQAEMTITFLDALSADGFARLVRHLQKVVLQALTAAPADASTNAGDVTHRSAVTSIVTATPRMLEPPEPYVAQNLQAEAIAGRLRYQRWKNRKIFDHVVRRDHPLLSVLAYDPFITRAQRFAVLEASLIGILLWASLFYRNECSLAKEIDDYHTHLTNLCSTPSVSYMPSVESILVSLRSTALSLLVPTILYGLFSKFIIEDLLLPAEKSFQMRSWEMMDIAGWTLWTTWNISCVVWLIIFVMGVDDGLMGQWIWASSLGLAYRLVLIPGLSILCVTAILILTKYISVLDPIILLVPSLVDFPHSSRRRRRKQLPTPDYIEHKKDDLEHGEQQDPLVNDSPLSQESPSLGSSEQEELHGVVRPADHTRLSPTTHGRRPSNTDRRQSDSARVSVRSSLGEI